ncbi:MAG TPA: cupredoxin domain-containing protein [Thermoanaerobaculia bacterium]|nr:cupredoxin domain-containing protein [Thermoanaerobaculia bacterium]
MKSIVKRAAIGLFGLLFALACRQGGGMMMSNDQMMEQMRGNPQMMDQMMRDPEMMQQMMERMMMSPEQCARMAETMSRNREACRNIMKAMADRMPAGSADQMMQHCEAMMTDAPPESAGTPASPAMSAQSVQEFTVNVSGSGFSPASLNVKKGQPVRIHFKRNDQPTCADEVVFAALNVRRKLPASQITTVDITPQKEGTLTFACGMDMMKGKLIVQ